MLQIPTVPQAIRSYSLKLLHAPGESAFRISSSMSAIILFKSSMVCTLVILVTMRPGLFKATLQFLPVIYFFIARLPA